MPLDDELMGKFTTDNKLDIDDRSVMVNLLAVMLALPPNQSYFLPFALELNRIKPIGALPVLGSNYQESLVDCGYRMEFGAGGEPQFSSGVRFNGSILCHATACSMVWYSFVWGMVLHPKEVYALISNGQRHMLNYVPQDNFQKQGQQRSLNSQLNYYALSRAHVFYTLLQRDASLRGLQIEPAFFWTQSLMRMFDCIILNLHNARDIFTSQMNNTAQLGTLEQFFKTHIFDFVTANARKLRLPYEASLRQRSLLSASVRSSTEHIMRCLSFHPIFPRFSQFREFVAAAKEKHAFLAHFMQKEPQLRCMRFIPLLFQFYHWLNETFANQYTEDDARRTTLGQACELLKHAATLEIASNAQILIGSVLSAWKEIRDHVGVVACQAMREERPYEVYMAELTLDTPLAVLVSHVDKSSYDEIFRVISNLCDTQNTCLSSEDLRQLVESREVNVNSIACPDALFGDMEVSLLPRGGRGLIHFDSKFVDYCLSHADVKGAAGEVASHETQLSFDLEAIERYLLRECISGAVTLQHRAFRTCFQFKEARGTGVRDEELFVTPGPGGVDGLAEDAQMRPSEKFLLLQRLCRDLPESKKEKLDSLRHKRIQDILKAADDDTVLSSIDQLLPLLRAFLNEIQQFERYGPAPMDTGNGNDDGLKNSAVATDDDFDALRTEAEYALHHVNIQFDEFAAQHGMALTPFLLQLFSGCNSSKWSAVVECIVLRALKVRVQFSGLGESFAAPLPCKVERYLNEQLQSILQARCLLKEDSIKISKSEKKTGITAHCIPPKTGVTAGAVAGSGARDNTVQQQIVLAQECNERIEHDHGLPLAPLQSILANESIELELYGVPLGDRASFVLLQLPRETFNPSAVWFNAVSSKKEHVLEQLRRLATSLVEKQTVFAIKRNNAKESLRRTLASIRTGFANIEEEIINVFLPPTIEGRHYSSYLSFLQLCCGKLQLQLLEYSEKEAESKIICEGLADGRKRIGNYKEMVPEIFENCQDIMDADSQYGFVVVDREGQLESEHDSIAVSDSIPFQPRFAHSYSNIRRFLESCGFLDGSIWDLGEEENPETERVAGDKAGTEPEDMVIVGDIVEVEDMVKVESVPLMDVSQDDEHHPNTVITEREVAKASSTSSASCDSALLDRPPSKQASEGTSLDSNPGQASRQAESASGELPVKESELARSHTSQSAFLKLSDFVAAAGVSEEDLRVAIDCGVLKCRTMGKVG